MTQVIEKVEIEAIGLEVPNRIVITDVHGHARTAVRHDSGARITIVELSADAHVMGTTEVVPSWPSYADRHQLARVVASLMDAGIDIFGRDFTTLVARYADPNSELGTGLPEIGAYDLLDWVEPGDSP